MPEKKRKRRKKKPPVNLASIDFRRKLPKRKEPVWQRLEVGVLVGYRSSNETWHAKLRKNGRTVKRIIGEADTSRAGDGETVFTYREAVKRALELAETDLDEAPRTKLVYTVADAAEDYLDYARARLKSYRETERVVRTRILPELGSVPVEKLTAKRIEAWLNGIARSKAQGRPAVYTNPETGKTIRKAHYLEREDLDEHERLRKRQATANRTLNVLKAMLNRAWERGDVSSLEWRKVKPFEGASKPVERFLTEPECQRLLEALPEDFGALVTGLLLTGARYSEIRQTRVRDCDPHHAVLTVTRPKRQGSGVRRIALTATARDFFSERTAGRDGGEYIFLRADGKPWGTSHQHRRMRKACEAAGISPPVGVHVLRHSVATHYLARGLSLKLISEALGHSSIAITAKHYAHVEESHLRRELDRHGMRLVKKPAKVETIG